jgi:hypothetical protein
VPVAIRIGRVALVVGGLALGVVVYRALLVNMPPLQADEAGHALPAARMALALGQGDLRGFLDATRRELVWPFMHPWLITAFFLSFEISARVARLSSLLTFGAALSLLPSLARELWTVHPDDALQQAPSSPHVIGWLSVGVLTAAAPWHIVCPVMSESLGMLLVVLTLLAEARAAQRNRTAWHIASGLLAAAAFFTKYSYGVPLMAAILFARVWRVRRHGIRPLLEAVVAMSMPVLLWLAAVLSPDLGRAKELVGVLANRDLGLHGFASFFFYANALVETTGWHVGAITIVALAAIAASGRWERRLTALLFVGITVVLLTLHPNKQERYLFPAVPIMLTLAEGELARRLGSRRRLSLWWPLLMATLLVARNPLKQLHDDAAQDAPLRSARPIVAYIADTVLDRQPVLFLGTTGLLPHYALTWEMLERRRTEPDVDLLTFPGERGWDPRYRSGYPTAMGPEYGLVLRRALEAGRYRSVVTLALGERSPFRPDFLAKWDSFGQNYVVAMAEQHVGYRLLSERPFPEGDAVVRIFVPDGRLTTSR